MLIRGSYGSLTRLLRGEPILLRMGNTEAVRIRQMRQRRVRTIRSRGIGYSGGLFLVLWALIAVVLITGNDPALSRKTSTATANASTSANTAASSSGATT